MPETRTVADVVWRSVSKFGVKTAFGVLGVEIDPVVAAIRNAGANYIQVHNEKSAGVMASVTAFLTGNLGVCVASVIPGVLALAPGLGEAVADRTPVLAITGQVESYRCGTDYTQESDDIAILKPLTVYSQMIMSPESAGLLTSIACRAALSRRGVAHIDIPIDIQLAPANQDWDEGMPTSAHIPAQPSEASLKVAADLAISSQNIMILAGRGASECGDLIAKLSGKLAAPVFTSYACLDLFASGSPFNMGVAFTTSPSFRRVAEKADLVIFIGTDYPYMREVFPSAVKKIQIEIDPQNAGRRVRIDAPLVGEARVALEGLNQLLAGDARGNGGKTTSYLDFARQEMSKTRSMIDRNANDTSSKPINPFYAVKAIQGSIKDDAIIALEGAGASRYFAYSFDVKKHKILRYGRYGILGYSVPAAIAAKLVYPDREVIAVSGDFGLMYSMTEMVTAVKYNIPIKVVVFNNGTQAAELSHSVFPKGLDLGEEFSFVKFAEACGTFGRRVVEPAELRSAADDVLSRNGVALLEIMTSQMTPQSISG